MSCASRESIRSVTHAAMCAAALLCFAGEPASGADERTSSEPADRRTVVFGSLDAGHSTFGSLGVKRTLTGTLDQSGPVGMAGVGYGRTIERVWGKPDGPRFTRETVHGSALLGYQWVRPGVVLAALAGPEIEGEQRSGHILERSSEAHAGLRLHGEIWAHPTDNTLLTTTVIAGRARTAHLWGRASVGYALWGGVFVGPEVSVYTTDTYREWRVGAHVTGFTLGPLSVRVSAGWRGQEDTRDDGAYVGLAAHIKM
jgi:Cellulose biosynthesis protein BcsS